VLEHFRIVFDSCSGRFIGLLNTMCLETLCVCVCVCVCLFVCVSE